jgi:hypothetical protein
MSASRMDAVLSRLQGVRAEGPAWVALCPAHEDRKPSLRVAAGDDGRVLVKCRAGCDFAAVVAALGLRPADLMPEEDARAWSPPKASPARDREPAAGWPSWRECAEACYAALGPWTHAHAYTEAGAREWAVVLRWKRADGTKEIRPVALHPDGRWRPSLPDGRKEPRSRSPYVRGDLAAARRVFVVEGEAKAELLETMGLVGVAAMGGAAAADRTDWTPLAGREVVVLPDSDPAGMRYAAEVVKACRSLEPETRAAVVPLPGLAEGSAEDLAEWVRDRHGGDAVAAAAELEALAAEAMEPKPPDGCVSLASLLSDPEILKPPDTVPSGCRWFDAAQPWGAVAEGRIVVLGGEMGSGKSRLLLALANGWARHDFRVAYLLGEMDCETLARRSIAAEAEVGLSALRNPTPEQRVRMEAARKRLVPWLGNLHAMEGRLTFATVEACAAWADVVVLDPLQAVRGPATQANRTEELEDFMRLLVRLSQRYGTVFVASSEIGKPPAAGSRDLFSAFKGSAAIPQYAHACYFAESPKGEEGEQWQTVRCLKQRDGPRLDLAVVVKRDRQGVQSAGGGDAFA